MTTTTTKIAFALIVTNDAREVAALVAEGYCPVECSIGGESLVDGLVMDHHGEYSHLESVAVRAYRDHFGARAADPRFVGVGTADADMSFAIAALAGMLPHPSKAAAFEDTALRAIHAADLSGLAATVARVDVNPIGLDIPSLEGGATLLCWNAMAQGARTSMAGMAAVQLWVNLTAGNPDRLRPYLGAAAQAENERRAAAIEDMALRAFREGEVLCLEDSRVFGFDVWYGRREEGGRSDEVGGWAYPVVIALNRGALTIGCPNNEVAEGVFGPGGLKAVFPHLPGGGWGGREAVGGSARGVTQTVEDLRKAAEVVATLIRR